MSIKDTLDTNFIDDLYRDQIATVDRSGKRIWIYPKQPAGRMYNYRKILSYLLLIVLFGLPFIKYNGKPFMLLNIPAADFIIFGVHFTPQDFHLFVLAMLIGMVFIALFTVVFGRVFCGWICPQTIFMEMVFRRVEYWIEGDSSAQKRLNKAPWTTDKAIKKTVKHGIFILISALIAHTFLAYIIGIDQVWTIMTDPLSEHWRGFIAMIVFTAIFYGVFSVMREQVCTTICPYGRMQGVLLDENSLAVSYDFVRGEPRGRISKKAAATDMPKGDCIDCKLCIKVCPTGIDIRNGTQLECINCTACIDACDEVMTKVDRPTGLIRIDSHKGIAEKKRSILNPRVIAYSAVLLVLIGVETYLFSSRSTVETLFLRTPGMLFQRMEGDTISNLYNYQLINKGEIEADITFEARDMDYVSFAPVGRAPQMTKEKNSEGAIFIKIPASKIKNRKTTLYIDVYADGQKIDEAKTTFHGPTK